jgi:hypothetical protein
MRDLSEYDFDQMLAEAVHRIGVDRVFRGVEPLARKYGWPIPADETAGLGRGTVALLPLPHEEEDSRKGIEVWDLAGPVLVVVVLYTPAGKIESCFSFFGGR